MEKCQNEVFLRLKWGKIPIIFRSQLFFLVLSPRIKLVTLFRSDLNFKKNKNWAKTAKIHSLEVLYKKTF